MKLTEYGKMIKRNNKDKIVLVKYGNFYRCIDNDALIMFYLFNYKITDNYKIGFPISIINNVLLKLKNVCISVILVNGIDNIIDYEIIDNKYNCFLDESKKHYNYISGVNFISELVKESLSKDMNNIEKIKEFILNL